MQDPLTPEPTETPETKLPLEGPEQPEQLTPSTNDDNKGEPMAKNNDLDNTKPTEENKSSFGETAKKILSWTKDAAVTVAEHTADVIVYFAKATFILVAGYTALYIGMVIAGLTFTGTLIAVAAIGGLAYLISNHIKHGSDSIVSVAKDSVVIGARSVTGAYQASSLKTAV